MVAETPSRPRLSFLLCPIVLLAAAVVWRVDESLFGLDRSILGRDRSQRDHLLESTVAGRSDNDTKSDHQDDNPTQSFSSIIEVAKLASTFNNSYCGESDEQPTDLPQVASHFGQLEPYFVVDDDEGQQSSSKTSASFTRIIALPFHAYDGNGTPRTTGGDEFVVTASGWSAPYGLAWKTSAVARDLGNGTYATHLRVPALHNDAVLYQVTLVHYYSCYQGFTRTTNSNSRAHQSYFHLNMGPISVVPSPTFAELVKSVGEATANAARSPFVLNVTALQTMKGVISLDLLPECPATQWGMNQLSAGVWIIPASSPEMVDTCSWQAAWVPSVCKPPMVVGGDLLRLDKGTTFQFFRVGDSTMPPAGGSKGNKWNIGDPFSANYKGLALVHHDAYIHILKHGLSQSEASDVLVLGHGLHQIQNGQYNVESAVESVVRMLCQIATVFPGKMLVQAPVPIQQQLYDKVDLTDANVNLFKALMREEITAANGQLADICRDVQLEVFYAAATESGNFVSLPETLRVFEERFRYRPEWNATSDELELATYFRELSAKDRQSLWGDRKVVYANPAPLLRPRPECYRDNDKIHALRVVEGRYMMDFGHGELLLRFAALRGKMGP